MKSEKWIRFEFVYAADVNGYPSEVNHKTSRRLTDDSNKSLKALTAAIKTLLSFPNAELYVTCEKTDIAYLYSEDGQFTFIAYTRPERGLKYQDVCYRENYKPETAWLLDEKKAKSYASIIMAHAQLILDPQRAITAKKDG